MMIKILAVISLTAILNACVTSTVTEQSADLVLTNAAIYTAAAGSAQVTAVAIKDGKYIAVGDDNSVSRFIGEQSEVINLQGAMAMPGINDAHLHPVLAGVKALYECNFAFTATPEDIAGAVRACAEKNADAAWIRGGQWGSNFFDLHKLESPREFLDALSSSHAIYLNDDSGHNAWVNSKALALAGIDTDTANPEGGTIVRNAGGEATGVLLETAIMLMDSAIEQWTDEQHIAAAAHSAQTMNSLGITGFKDAGYLNAPPMAFHTLDQQGKLNAHAAVCLATPYGTRTEPLDLADLEQRRERFASTNVHTNFVKIFMDGVPTPARTAAMIHPYLPDEQHGDNYRGSMHLSAERLTEDVIALDKLGFTIKIHTAGDGSVRVALDAIEAARKANGNSGLQHELAHGGYIDPADMSRFSSLGVAADFSPYLWHPSPIMDAVISAVGEERGPQYWPTRSLLASGASVIAGSDWPSAVPSANPWVGLEALVTRRDPHGEAEGSLWPEEAISLEQALQIYTMAGAKALKLQDVTGSIEVGKSADLIVLDRNLFEVPIDEVSDTTVQKTYFRGRLVYSR
ncbi:MAG: amidohydrolase [Pseudomonadales bacterium]